MPYLMGGFPDLERSRGDRRGLRDGGADLVELGVPYSDPLADGPVIHAAGTAALRGGRHARRRARRRRARSRARVPVVVMCYANLVFARGRRAFADGARASAALSGLIVPDLPLEEAPALLAACDARRRSRSCRSSRRRRRTSAWRAIGARARGFLYTVSVAGTTGERQARSASLEGVIARARAHTEVPVALGFGIGTPEQAAAAADAGADGVIVGTRLVREAGGGRGPRGRGPRGGRRRWPPPSRARVPRP